MQYPQFGLSGRVALVTGAARGLGRAISLALANAGADVALGLRDVQAGSGLAAEIGKMGRRVLPLQMDMRKMEQISHAVDETAKEFGRIDILVNNTGIAPENLAENVSEEDFDATIAVNLKGTFFASQAAGRLMIRQKSGTIINMSSQAGFAALPTESIYCMTKAGIAHLTKCLAVEWGKYGITVNAVLSYVHPHTGDGERTRRYGISRGHTGADRCATPYWRADGSGRGGCVSGLPRCIVDHRRDDFDLWGGGGRGEAVRARAWAR